MRYQLSVYQIWEYGQRTDAQGNPHQEDNMYPPMGMATVADRLFIVCDGMGGHDAGEVASATVCEALSQSILSQQPDPQGPFTTDMLITAIRDAYNALDARDTCAERKMGTTLTLLKLHDRGAMIAHMGDSRVYHIRPGKTADTTQILHQTCDHSLVKDLIKVGEITPEEARDFPLRNVITRAMQPNTLPRFKAEIYETADIRPGDIFYLCTDGMLENMEDAQIKYNFSQQAGDSEQRRLNLINATEHNRDNHTAIIVEILDVADPLPLNEATPAAKTATALSTPAKPQTPRTKSRRIKPITAVLIALIVALIAVVVCLVVSLNSGKVETSPAAETPPPASEAAAPTHSSPAADINISDVKDDIINTINAFRDDSSDKSDSSDSSDNSDSSNQSDSSTPPTPPPAAEVN